MRKTSAANARFLKCFPIDKIVKNAENSCEKEEEKKKSSNLQQRKETNADLE